MTKSQQKRSEKNVTDARLSLIEEDPRESILCHVYPHLPAISEEKWLDLLQSEDEDHVRYKIRDESSEAARNLKKSEHLSNKAFSFVTMCCHMAWMKIIRMNFMEIDPGEESENFSMKWRADTEPSKSPHASDFWPIPDEFDEDILGIKSNLSTKSDTGSTPKSESGHDRRSIISEVETNICEVELHNLKTRINEDFLGKCVPIDPSPSHCYDSLKKEETEQIMKLLGPEKSFIKNVDKFPNLIPKKPAKKQNEDEDERKNILMWYKNLEEKVSFIQKLPEDERRHFLPYFPMLNEFLESDELDIFQYGNC